MTISSELRKAGPFAGNGVVTLFPFNFKVFDKTDIKLLRVDANGASTQLTLDSDYSVLVNANQNANPGGTITYPITGSPLPVGLSLTVLGDLTLLQPTDLTNQGGFYPQSVEDMSDRSTIQIQQLDEKLSRALVITEAENTSPVLPSATARAGMLLGFDSQGNPEVFSVPPSVGAGAMHTDTFVAGVDFVGGTTAVLTLSRVYGSPDNLEIHFDTEFQGPENIQSLNGATLTLTAPIPNGIQKVYVRGGTTLSIYTPADGSVTNSKIVDQAVNDRTIDPTSNLYHHIYDQPSLRDSPYNGKVDGVADDSAAIIAYLANYDTLALPPGACRIGTNLTIPNGKVLKVTSGTISVDAGKTLTIAGRFEAPVKTIFTGAGSVVGMREAWPEWWGAVGDGVTDDWIPLTAQHTAVQASLNSDGPRPTLRFGSHQYSVTKTLVWAPTANINLSIEGNGIVFTGTRFKVPSTFASVGPAVLIDGNTDGTQCITDMQVKGIGAVATLVGSIGSCTGGIQVGSTDPTKKLIGLHRNLMEDIFVSGIPNGLSFCHTALINVRRWSVWNDGIAGANNCVNITQNGGNTTDITFYDGQTVNAHGVSGANGVNIVSNKGSYLGGGNTIAGIKFKNCDFYNGDKGVSLFVGGGSLLSDIWFDDGCEWDGGNTNSVYMESHDSGSLLQDIHVSGTAIFGGTGTQISLASTGTFGTVMDIFVHDNWMDGGLNAAVFVAANGGGKVQGIHVNDNTIRENNYQAGPAIEMSGVSRFRCSGNLSSRLSGVFFLYMVKIDADCDNFVVSENVGAGIASAATINNLAGTGATKIVANNL